MISTIQLVPTIRVCVPPPTHEHKQEGGGVNLPFESALSLSSEQSSRNSGTKFVEGDMLFSVTVDMHNM